MDENLLREYAEVRREREAIERREKEIKDKLFGEFQKNDIEKLPTDYGTFTLSKGRPKWEYSESLQKRLERVKIAQIDEQEQGIAKELPGTPYLQFKPNNS